MFFVLSKVLWFLANPGNLLLIFLGLGVLLMWTRWRRAGRVVVTVCALMGAIFATVPFGGWMRTALEDRFPPVGEPPARVDGIVVLGGVINMAISQARGQTAIGGAVERVTALASLARRYPEARLIFSGGSGKLFDQEIKEGPFVAPLFRQLGLDPRRIVFDDRSRNTAENAEYSFKLANPQPGETWLLITSAFHMPRAVGAFRRAGWVVVPYPVDFNTRGGKAAPMRFSFAGGLASASGGLHEWLGLFFYWITGRTDAFFPAPDG